MSHQGVNLDLCLQDEELFNAVCHSPSFSLSVMLHASRLHFGDRWRLAFLFNRPITAADAFVYIFSLFVHKSKVKSIRCYTEVKL